MGSKTLKRLISSVLSLSILCTQFVTMPVLAETKTPVSLSEGQVILNNYNGPALTDAEKNVMLNENIDSTKLSYVAPTDEDGLLTFDGNKVVAEEYTDSEGNLWVPVSAVLKEDGEPDVAIDLSTGLFEPKTNSYSVEVEYETYTTISAEKQTKMLNLAHYLVNGIENVETLANEGADSLTVLTNKVTFDGKEYSIIELFYEYFVVGKKYYPVAGNSFNVGFALKDAESEAAINAITNLYEDLSNGGFDFANLASEYKASYAGSGEVSFFKEGKADSLRIMASTILENAEAIYNCVELKSRIYTIGEVDENVGSVIKTVVNSIGAEFADDETTIVEAMKAGLNGDWSVLAVLDVLPESYTETLKTAVLAAKGNTVGGYVVTEEKLTLASANVVISQARNNVKVVVDATVYEGNVETALHHEETLRLATGMTVAEVDALVDATVQNHINANWAKYNLNNDNYKVTWAYADFDVLDRDVDYNIEYEPNYYEVTGVLAGTYPYGWVLTLPSGAAEEKLYTYTVNGVTMQENETIKVTEDIQIARVEQAKKRLLSLLVTDLGLDTESIEAKVLNSDAVKSDYVSYDVPKDGSSLLSLSYDNGVYTLTAQECELSGTGMKWIPYEYYVGDTAYPFNGTYTVDINDNSITSVKVDYKLQLTQHMSGTITPEYAAERANLPYTLWTLTNNQYSAVQSLRTMLDENKGDLGLIPTALGMLRTNIRAPYDTDKDGYPDSPLSAYDQEVVNKIGVILNDCFVTISGSEMLSVAHYASFYQTAADMVYYYDTAENPEYGYYAFVEQLDTLIANLGDVIAHPQFLKLFENEQFKGKDELVTGVIEKLQAKRDDMANYPPSSYIDVTKDSARSLFANLLGAASVSSMTTDSVNVHTFFSVKADGYVGVTVNVVVNGYDGAEIGSSASSGDIFTMSLAGGETFTQNHIDKIDEEVAKLLNGVLTSDVQKVFEQVSVENMPALGDSAAEKQVIVKYAPKTVTVNVEGAAPQTIAYGNTKINLPESSNAGEYYEYNILGNVVTTSTYTFTEAELVQIVEAGGLTVTRTVVNVSSNNMKDLVEKLNSGVTGESKFILLEKDGEFKIVLRLAANELSTVSNMIMGAAEGLASSSYNFVALAEDSDEYAFWGVWNETQLVSVQGLINGILASGLSFDSIINADSLDASVVDGYDIVVGGSRARAPFDFGSDVIATKMYLGLKGFSNHSEVPFYVTVTGDLTEVQNALVALKPYIDVNTNGGKLNAIINIPDRAYQAILVGMLATGYADLDDITNVQMDALVSYLDDQLNEAVINPAVSADTYQNTLDKVNAGYSLAQYKDTINKVLKAVRALYAHATFGTCNGNTLPYDFKAHSNDVIELMGLTSPFDAMVKKEDLTLNGTLTANNLGTAYEAVIFDNSKEGLDKAFFAKDFAAVAPSLGNNAIVILLGDVAGDVVLNNGIILDLNGKTMPSLKANAGTTKIFNSAFEADGGVTGTISGNFTIAGGKYGSDVSSMVVEGYTQTNGVVESDLYRAYMDGNKLVVELEVDFLDPARETDLTYFAIDLALQLGLEFYTASKLNVEGSDIYAFESTDLIADFFGDTNIVNTALHILNYPGLTTFTNTVIDDLTNWGALATAVESGNPLVSYDLTTTPWGVSLTHIAAEDYMSVAVAGDSSVAKDYTLEIRVRGNASDDDNVYLAKLLREFEKVLTVDADVALNDVSYSNEHGLTADYFGDGEIVIDFTQADNGEDYTTLMGLILAYANPSMKTPLQNYINKGDVAGLIDAFDELTVANVISAIKSIRGVSFAKLSAGYDAADVAYLESIYHVFLQGTAGVLNKLEVTGRSTKLGTLAVADGVYEIEKSLGNISGKITLKLFAEKDPVVTAYAKVNADKILAWEIDYTNHVIKLDLAVTKSFNGLALDKFGDEFYLGFEVNGGVLVNTTFDQDTVNAGVLRNGTVVVVEYAKNTSATPSQETWTIQIVGDVNCNGLIESNDAALIAKKFVNNSFTLNDTQTWAADVNGNGTLESNDALLNAYKWTLQTDKYTSKLRNVEEGK